MSAHSWDPMLYIQATSALMQVPLPSEAEAGVRENLERMSVIAQLVMEFPLAEDCEAAPTFQP